MTAPTTGTALDTSELRAMLAAATQGRWYTEPDTLAGRVWVAIGRKWWPKADAEPIFQVRNEDNYEQRAHDAALICAAVNNLEALLDAADRLAAVKALHRNEDGYCAVCIDAYEAPHEWPCPTAALATDTTTEDS